MASLVAVDEDTPGSALLSDPTHTITKVSAGCCRAWSPAPGWTSACTPTGSDHTYAAELAREGTAINVIRDTLGRLAITTATC
ncbi:MAG: hypothetical protein JOZ07_02960 [Solirubrobacterales bacterium]|nr:hypothetical protein [Solirubrobacterales bacterium]